MKTKIALVYDRVNTAYGGAEQVLLALQTIYPEADLFSPIYNARQAQWANQFKTIKTSVLQKIPFSNQLYRYMAALMPFAFESLDLSNYDIVISITSGEAKGVITRRDQLHLCYLLSPPRYLYHYQDEYLRQDRFLQLPIIYGLAKLALTYLKNWDQMAIYRPDLVIPIAAIVKTRAQKYYPDLKLEQVIYPPINTHLLDLAQTATYNQQSQPYFLLVSRLVPYKNVAAAILACQHLGKRLIIVGEGPEERKLKKIAQASTTFQKRLSHNELATLYQNCQAVLSPGLDDFGIAAMEANLFAKPIVINQLSGAAELIKDGQNGIHMPYQENDQLSTIVAHLVASIKKLEQTTFDQKILSKNALKYDTNRFTIAFDRALQKAYNAKLEGKL